MIARRSITATRLILLASLFLVAFDNLSFWNKLFTIIDDSSSLNAGFVVSNAVFLLALFNLVLSLFAFKYVLKPVLIIVLFCAAAVNYFTHSYGVIINSSMIRNVFETDPREAGELMTLDLFYYLFLLGLVPSILIYLVKVEYKPLLKEASLRILIILASVSAIALTVGLQYKTFSLVYRNNREIRYFVNPTYPFYALYKYISKLENPADRELVDIGADALRDASRADKKKLVILVVGETARAQNFELNDYHRDTNPRLKNADIFNFSNTYSCGTDTAESIPCIFSRLGHDDVGRSNPARYKNLLDVLARTGVHVLWRDNNSGCKGVCKRVKTENMTTLDIPGLCNDDGCYDEVLLYNLQQYVDQTDDDTLIVLHQDGSHGPAYFKRYPESFRVFTPECTKAQVQDCPQQDIINSYDNTILYTDYFLSKVIDFLKQNSSSRDTAMIYFSDHGESLGENGIYLHGLPYFLAPDEQKHIPMIMWLSRGYTDLLKINRTCLTRSSGKRFSHDNVFDTVLDLFRIKTGLYNPEGNIFASCKDG